eukprot:m.514957 g.514957  ORF g.514957 m.514957 type:complete len:55 (+) comp21915_c0_seq12:2128-2292(+)
MCVCVCLLVCVCVCIRIRESCERLGACTFALVAQERTILGSSGQLLFSGNVSVA